MSINNNVGTWYECVVDNDYEINDQYPYPLKRKSNGKIVKEFNASNGYIQCHLNQKTYNKHKIIAQQFIPNPNNLPEVDHINNDRSDNHIENLRWVTASENGKNRSGHGRKYTFLDELPETAEALDSYNGYDFDGLYIDYDNEKLYLFNGIRYRELVPCRNHGGIRYIAYDIEGKQRSLSHKVLFG